MAVSKFKSKSEFEIIGQLGEGGFGAALLATHGKEQFVLKQVNLTRLYAELCKNGDENTEALAAKLVAMARNEHMQMLRCQHENIVKVHAAFEEKNNGSDVKDWKGHDMYYMVMEYCEGGDMNTFIRDQKNKPVSENRIRAWSSQLVSAVKFLHDHGIVHRDIKPHNIFLTTDLRTVKLGDFGLAKEIDG